MTRVEALAYNAGVLAVLDLARRSSAALAPAAVARVTRIGFAQAALDALADEGATLLLPVPIDPRGTASAMSPG